MTYTLTKKQMTQLRSKLTKAKNGKSPEVVKAVCRQAFAVFQECGFPDSWAHWSIAYDDACEANDVDRFKNPFYELN